MNQIFFLMGLYLVGVLVVLPFRPRIPALFAGVSGFLWGGLVFVILRAILLVCDLPYTGTTLAVLAVLVFSVLIAINIWKKGFSLTKEDALPLVISIVAFGFVVVGAHLFNSTVATIDSLNTLMYSRDIAINGFSPLSIRMVSNVAPFALILQSGSTILDLDYFSAAQPAFGFTLLSTFGWLLHRSIKQVTGNLTWSLLLSVLGVVFLLTIDLFNFHIFYIHTNLIAAVYLFAFFGAVWQTIRERETAWLVFAILALLGFSLARTETVLFSLAALIITFSVLKISYKERLLLSLPFLLVMSAWFLFLAVKNNGQVAILRSDRLLLVIGLMLFFGGLFIFMRYTWFMKFLQKNITILVMVGLVGTLLGLGFLRAGNLEDSIKSLAANLFFQGRWGITWYLLFGLFIHTSLLPKLDHESFFKLSILVYLGFILVLGCMRTTAYHITYSDSGNRMMLHILPVFLFYIILKYSGKLFTDSLAIK